MGDVVARRQDEVPDQRVIGELHGSRLAKLSGIPIDQIVGSTVADLGEKLKWQVDPIWFLYRRVCGRVVKRDPATGVLHGVPHATVHVEDTDCNLLWYSPVDWIWGWFFPFWCQREEIATTVTDECGYFCAYIPRFDIDWILQWRRRTICWEIFVKPSIREIVEGLRPVVERPVEVVEWPARRRPPGGDPDPPEVRVLPGPTLRRAEELLGRTTARALLNPDMPVSPVSPDVKRVLLDLPRFPDMLPPPLGPEFGQLDPEEGKRLLAGRLDVDPDRLKDLALSRYIGPFWRCVDFAFPEWSPIFDVPDITFRVTQDVDGDGDQEEIYSEGFFDTRWDAGPIPDVTLVASSIAVSSVACGTPPVPCVNVEAITRIGLMPVESPPAPAAPYLDQGTGYARRVNRPHPSGHAVEAGPLPPATAPFLGTLQLYGCHHRAGATKYRVMYALSDGGSRQPLIVPSWPMSRNPSHPLPHFTTIAQDPNGWLPILPDAEGWEPDHLILNWPTGAGGRYLLDIEFADDLLHPVGVHTTPIPVHIDNSAPLAQQAVGWRKAGEPAFIPLSSFCPVVDRPVGTDLEFQVQITVSSEHLRFIRLLGGGCGGAVPKLTSAIPALWEATGPAMDPTGLQHWHTGPLDTGAALSAIFSLSASAPRGVYSFNLWADTRGFNPSGGDGGFEADWNYDPLYRLSNPVFTFAVNDV